MIYRFPFCILALISILFLSCQGQKNNAQLPPSVALSDYWYQGKAEISTYELTQNRYNDQHPGEAVLVFVTEDFLTDEQVKNDRGQNPNSTKVMKTNFIKRFTTGLYDYSIMTSVFTAVDQSRFPGSFKVTMSSQDWCGQSFMQLNKSAGQYKVQLRSYFESEGDENTSIPVQILEDELFNLIRMSPDLLPKGQVQMIPPSSYCRLKHIDMKAYPTEAAMMSYQDTLFEGKELMSYHVKYADLNRRLQIVFEKASPHKIEGWIEEYPSAFDNQLRKTIAIKKADVFSPYWKKNHRSDSTARKKLDLHDFD